MMRCGKGVICRFRNLRQIFKYQALFTISVYIIIYLARSSPMRQVYSSIRTLLEEKTPSPIYEYDAAPDEDDRLLTLFTTWGTSSGEKEFIHRNTIENWRHFYPDVQPIIFNDSSNDEETMSYAKKCGWMVLSVPRTLAGVPVIKDMFLHARNSSKSHFYGYANSDIIFGTDLISTLKALRRFRFNQVLIVGQRRNLDVTKEINITDPDEANQYSRNLTLFNSNAQDYFITTANGFPWEVIPDFVVGRIGYDNWLIVHSIIRDIPVVDVTVTVSALHQTGKDGNFAGHNKRLKKSDLYHNYRIAGAKFDYRLGLTSCSQFETTNADNVTLVYRKRNLCAKNYLKRMKNPLFFENSIRKYKSVVSSLNTTDKI